MKDKIKNIIIIVLIILFISSLIVIYKLTTNKEIIKELIGVVIVTNDSYVIVSSQDSDYLINNIKGFYNVGDEVKFIYNEKDLNDKEEPKVLKILDEEIIKVASIDETNDNIIDTDNDLEDSSINNNQLGDDIILNYFNDVENDFKEPKDSLKDGFVTVIDFLFYNGSIKGYTFNELSDSAKLKVLALALYFDSKIDSYFPDYKENISNTTSKIYTNIKTRVITLYLNITTSICSNNKELCLEAKENFGVLKTNFGLTWSLIKDIAGDGLDNLKNWYEIWRG